MGSTTKAYLIELFALLVDTQDADIADMVMAAGIHAAGDVQVDRAQVVQEIQVVKAALNGFRDGDRLGIGQGAEVATRAADDVVQGVQVGGGKAHRGNALPKLEQSVLADIGEDNVLFMGGPNFAEAVFIGQVCNVFQLGVCYIARRCAGFLEGQGDDGVTGLLVLVHVVGQPLVEFPVLKTLLAQQVAGVFQCLIVRLGKVALKLRDRVRGETGGGILDLCPLSLDLFGEPGRCQGFYQNLDTRLELVVPAAIAVVHPNDGLEVSEQVQFRQELPDNGPNHGGAAETAAGVYPETQLTLFIPDQLQADVMNLDGGPVGLLRSVHCNLELAGQEGEFRMKGRPLPDDFAVGPRIGNFVRLHAGELVCGGVADAVAAGLVGMHFHFGQFRQDIRHIFQVRPVQLDVGPGGYVGVATVVIPGNPGQPAQLFRAQHAVGHADSEHGGMTLNIETVLEAKGKEFLFGKLTGQCAFGLIPELGHTLGCDLLVVFIVNVHRVTSCLLHQRVF